MVDSGVRHMFSKNEIHQTADERFGKLLVQAGLVAEDTLEIALQITLGFGDTLGQVLVETQKMTVMDFQNALFAQAWIEAGLLDRGTVVSLLNSSHKKRVAIHQVLSNSGKTMRVAA